MSQASIFNQLLIWPILNSLIFFYKLFSFFGIPGAFGFSILILTILIRFLLSPIFSTQLKSAQKIQELKPKMEEISKKYGNDKVRLQKEQLKLYQEAGINPAAGCLPLLLQMPLFIALYQVFWQILGNGNQEKVIEEINRVVYFSFLKISSLDLSFLGISLADKPSLWQTNGWWLLLVPLITGVLQWYQTKIMSLPITQNSKIKDNKEDSQEEDMAKIMQKQMNFLFPLMIGWFSYSFPVGLSLYWNTFTILSIIQQRKLRAQKS